MSKNEDTEITLGTGKMLGLFFGLVILCAVFFGMGFSMGKNSVKSGPELLPSPSSSGTRRPEVPAKPVGYAAAPSDSKAGDQTPSSTDAGSGSSPAPATSDQPAPAAIPPGTGYFVQVAAVSKQEDADALVESLKGRQYSAFIVTPSPDKFFHVQVGPFADVKEAEAMRAKLMSDGYNPILKK
jgi:cell division septation protein DedD